MSNGNSGSSQAVLTASNVAATGMQGLLQYLLQKYTHKQNIEMQDRAHAQNLDMWNLANVYNLPENQMQRLRDAGLNPMLMQGGGVSGNVAGEIPKYQAPVADYRQNIPLTETLSMYNRFKTDAAQRDMIKEQTDYYKNKAITEGFASANMQLRNLRDKLDYRKASTLEQNFYDVAKLNLENLQQELLMRKSNLQKNALHMDLLGRQSVLADYQAEHLKGRIDLLPMQGQLMAEQISHGRFDNELRAQGINPNDPFIMRFLGRMIPHLFDDKDLSAPEAMAKWIRENILKIGRKQKNVDPWTEGFKKGVNPFYTPKGGFKKYNY